MRRRVGPVRGDAAGGPPPAADWAADPRSSAAVPVLAAIQAFLGVAIGLFAVFPPLPATPRAFFAVAAACCLVLAAGTAVLVPRLPVPWLGTSAAAVGLVVAASAFFVTTPQGQVGAGLALALPAVFAAQYVSRWLLGALLAVMVGTWVLGLVVNPVLPGATVWAVGIVGVLVGVSVPVSQLQLRLRFQAEHDPLTGALGRRGLEQRAVAARALAARSGTATSVVLIDLDGFKAFNDEHGHLAGDDLLRSLVAGWYAHLRVSDLVARFGGDEFALVLPGASIAEAEEIVNRLRATSPAAWTSGAVEWRADESLYSALGRADDALYRAKDLRTGTAGGPVAERPDAGQTTP